jgi:hypothetical protein
MLESRGAVRLDASPCKRTGGNGAGLHFVWTRRAVAPARFHGVPRFMGIERNYTPCCLGPSPS